MKIKLINILFDIEGKPEHHEKIKKTEHHEGPKKPEEFAQKTHETKQHVDKHLKNQTHRAEKLARTKEGGTEMEKKVHTKVDGKVRETINGASVDSVNPPVVRTQELSQLQKVVESGADAQEKKEALTEYKASILKKHISTDELPGFKEYTEGLAGENEGGKLSKEELEAAKQEYIDGLSQEELNKIYQTRMGELVVDKDGKKIPSEKYQKLLKEVPALGELEKTDPQLAKDAIALYGQDVMKAMGPYLEKLQKDGKLPDNLEDFDKVMKEFQEQIKEESIENPDAFKAKIDAMVESGQISKETGAQMTQGITSKEAANTKAMPLPENFDSLDGKAKTLALIKKFEGFNGKSFWDYKQYTRGYGTKAPGAGATISESKASTELEQKINSNYNLGKYLDQQTMNGMGDNQKAAMTSFIFNLGPGKLQSFKPMLKEYANATGEQKQQIAKQIGEKMQNYNKAGGKILKGLVSRRKTEAELFMKESKTSDNKDSSDQTKKA